MSARGSEGRDEAEEPRRPGGGLWEQVSTLLIAVLIALAIRAFVIEPYRIPSGSMLPTLLIGDHLFVNKFVYGIKVPFTDIRLPGMHEPRRGDVVVFTVAKEGGQTFPADRRPDLPTEQFVKRIVGLPGDRVEVIHDDVYINGEKMPSRPLKGEFRDEEGDELLENQAVLGDHTFITLDDPNVKFPSPGPRIVAAGRYFMMGDNRDHSKDSRVWGTVRLAEIKGPAFILYWSWDFNGTWGQLLNPANWWDLFVHKVRWNRIGKTVP